jgi:hypothetical protein
VYLYTLQRHPSKSSTAVYIYPNDSTSSRTLPYRTVPYRTVPYRTTILPTYHNSPVWSLPTLQEYPAFCPVGSRYGTNFPPDELTADQLPADRTFRVPWDLFPPTMEESMYISSTWSLASHLHQLMPAVIVSVYQGTMVTP